MRLGALEQRAAGAGSQHLCPTARRCRLPAGASPSPAATGHPPSLVSRGSLALPNSSPFLLFTPCVVSCAGQDQEPGAGVPVLPGGQGVPGEQWIKLPRPAALFLLSAFLVCFPALCSPRLVVDRCPPWRSKRSARLAGPQAAGCCHCSDCCSCGRCCRLIYCRCCRHCCCCCCCCFCSCRGAAPPLVLLPLPDLNPLPPWP